MIGAYLLAALFIGISVRRRASANRVSYFLAGRSIPWWWAGASIAATTFAADTPLAITGLVASRGLSGNWLWLSWIGVHAAVVVLFARGWNRSGVLTDAELIAIRYSGRAAAWLRSIRAGLYGIVFNCLILGWVLRAMVKIAAPFFRWDEWFPGPVSRLETVWSGSEALAGLGTPSEAISIVALLILVGIYSALGGIRGVMLTDLVQLVLALAGGTWFAFAAWNAVGGRSGLVDGLASLYGPGHGLMNLLPDPESGWLGAAGVGAFTFGAYVIVQSYSNMPADGGGYLMQRLNTTPSPDHARRAAALFLVVQYVVRVWPWFIVALAALVLIPIGAESEAFEGAGAPVAGDRELAYPVLMGLLLGPGVLGIMVVSLLAAFMSTVDTHLNWGASYVVNDVFLRLRPGASARRQILWARAAVGAFVLLSVIVSLQIRTIEQGWRWLATLGAAIGLPTALRWIWWRVTAAGELCALGAGIVTAIVLAIGTEVPYETALILTSAASLVGLLGGIAIGPPTDPDVLSRFVRGVSPPGIWPGRSVGRGIRGLGRSMLRWSGVVAGTVMMIASLQRALLFADHLAAAWLGAIGLIGFVWGVRGPAPAPGPVAGSAS